MIRTGCLFAGLALATAAMGCGCSPQEKSIEIKPSNDPLLQARAVLERYAAGQPLSSEVSTFPQLIADVRKADPARADILEKGLAEIQKAPANSRPAKAKELLAKLQPSMH